jgi:HEAT repeats
MAGAEPFSPCRLKPASSAARARRSPTSLRAFPLPNPTSHSNHSTGNSAAGIVSVTDPDGPLYDNLQFVPAGDLLVAHRSDNNQGEAVTDQVKDSGDPSQYTILVDDYYVNSDGTPALDSDTAEIPDDSGDGDSDLARITLNQLPSGMTDGYVQIVLSDPTAVRLFESGRSLLYEDDTTGDAPLTLDLSDPSGYLAGLQSGNVNVWLEGGHANTDFSFTVLYEDSQGDVTDSDSVHMTLADWNVQNNVGEFLNGVQPILEQELLDDLQSDTSDASSPVSENVEASFYKNVIFGLPEDLQVQLQVTSEDGSLSYVDNLIDLPNEAVSSDFQAIYSTDDDYGDDPLSLLTSSQQAALLSLLSVNLLPGPTVDPTLVLGDADAPTDEFSRPLTVGGLMPYTVNSVDGVYTDGQTITITAPEAIPGQTWLSGRIGPGAKAAAGALETALHDPDGSIRVAAGLALWRVGCSDVALKALIEELQRPDSTVRYRAAMALAEFGPAARSAVPALIAALKNYPSDRSLIAQSLGRIGPDARAVVPALIDIFENAPELVKDEVAAALKAIDPKAAALEGIR